jgi:hypothetical protein
MGSSGVTMGSKSWKKGLVSFIHTLSHHQFQKIDKYWPLGYYNIETALVRCNKNAIYDTRFISKEFHSGTYIVECEQLLWVVTILLPILNESFHCG